MQAMPLPVFNHNHNHNPNVLSKLSDVYHLPKNTLLFVVFFSKQPVLQSPVHTVGSLTPVLPLLGM